MENKLATRKIQVKKPLTLEDKSSILAEALEAHEIITRKKEELKSYSDATKDFIKEQEEIMEGCFLKAKTGYSLEIMECNSKIIDGKEIFTDKNGVVLDDSIIVVGQQIKLEDDLDGEND